MSGNSSLSGVPGVAAYFTGGFDAVHHRHLHVHQHQIVEMLADHLHGDFSVGGDGNRDSRFLQQFPGHLLIQLVVLHQQHRSAAQPFRRIRRQRTAGRRQ